MHCFILPILNSVVVLLTKKAWTLVNQAFFCQILESSQLMLICLLFKLSKISIANIQISIPLVDAFFPF